MKFAKIIVAICTVSLTLLIFTFSGCGGSNTITDLSGRDTVSYYKFADKFSADFTDTNSIRKLYLREGLANIAQFLYEQDPDAFSELINQSTSPIQIREFLYKNYNEDFIELSEKYYYWADAKAEKKYEAKADYKSFKMKETENFVFVYNPQLSENDISFLTIEAENVLYKLKSLFHPDSASLSNFRRLSVYKGWFGGNLKDTLGVFTETAGKIPVIITATQQEMFDISGGHQMHAGRFGGLTTFSPILDKDSIKFVCRVLINYSNPLSSVPLAHEIAHAFSFVVFSRPNILDSLVNIYKPTRIEGLGLELLQPSMMRLTVVTAEGLGQWGGWQTSVFSEAGILPSVHELLLQRSDELPSLKGLIAGDIDISFWDIVKNIFGSPPTYKFTTFLLGSASFLDYLIHNSTAEQLYAVFSGGQNELTANDLETIYGKNFSEIENEWKSYVINYKFMNVDRK